MSRIWNKKSKSIFKSQIYKLKVLTPMFKSFSKWELTSNLTCNPSSKISNKKASDIASMSTDNECKFWITPYKKWTKIWSKLQLILQANSLKRCNCSKMPWRNCGNNKFQVRTKSSKPKTKGSKVKKNQNRFQLKICTKCCLREAFNKIMDKERLDIFSKMMIMKWSVWTFLRLSFPKRYDINWYW